jgi:hypothetical protein
MEAITMSEKLNEKGIPVNPVDGGCYAITVKHGDTGALSATYATLRKGYIEWYWECPIMDNTFISGNKVVDATFRHN